MALRVSRDDLAARARAHLERIVAIDSCSDERSQTVPSTPGQSVLAEDVGAFFADLGARVERDEHANVLAWLPGRGSLKDAETLAMLVHLDTAAGTRAPATLKLTPAWSGDAIPFPAVPEMRVDVATFPTTSDFLGHDLLHGLGDAPFGLDDKLGLAHMMTLAWLLAGHPELDHRPLVLVGRPDEEIGRDEALFGLAARLADAGVRSGYTIDGFLPYEINVANFNAALGGVLFPHGDAAFEGERRVLRLQGVNTHGATAKAEGHRAATELAAQLLDGLAGVDVCIDGFCSDHDRDCDALVGLRGTGDVDAVLNAGVDPHRVRGADWRWVDEPLRVSAAAAPALRWIASFLSSDPGFPLAAQDSAGWQGYSHPYRILDGDFGLELQVRLRDFDVDQLERRKAHVLAQAGDLRATTEEQYTNMAPRLAGRRDLVDDALQAAERLNITAPETPIRGGTGIDPFLDAGIALANLGTGYFAPESEKEFTSLQALSGHARWLLEIVTTAPSG
jgi:di/tripeptidase